jgi:hypothetical protein
VNKAQHKAQKRIIETKMKLRDIVDICAGRIQRQGGGCTIPDLGSAYKYNGRSCAIGILLAPKEIHWNTYGVISAFEQRYLVNKISKRYTIPEHEHSRDALVKLLQKIQNAHDWSFDTVCYAQTATGMKAFLEHMEAIKTELTLEINRYAK